MTHSSPINLVLAVAVAAGLAAFWFAFAPHIAIRHWVTDTNANVQCRQMLNGANQWSAPALGWQGWRVDSGTDAPRC